MLELDTTAIFVCKKVISDSKEEEGGGAEQFAFIDIHWHSRSGHVVLIQFDIIYIQDLKGGRDYLLNYQMLAICVPSPFSYLFS